MDRLNQLGLLSGLSIRQAKGRCGCKRQRSGGWNGCLGGVKGWRGRQRLERGRGGGGIRGRQEQLWGGGRVIGRLSEGHLHIERSGSAAACKQEGQDDQWKSNFCEVHRVPAIVFKVCCILYHLEQVQLNI